MPTLEMQNNAISFSIDSIISRKDPPKNNSYHVKPLIECNTRVQPVSDGQQEGERINYNNHTLDPTRTLQLENNPKNTFNNPKNKETSHENTIQREAHTENLQRSRYFCTFVNICCLRI